jgi:hypothetical protein
VTERPKEAAFERALEKELERVRVFLSRPRPA